VPDAFGELDGLGLTLVRHNEDGGEWASPGVVVTVTRDADGELIGTIRRRGSRVAIALDELAGGETPEAWAEYLRSHPAALRGDRKVFAPLEGRSRDRLRAGAAASDRKGPPPRRDHLK
jgi:hypothetical protein